LQILWHSLPLTPADLCSYCKIRLCLCLCEKRHSPVEWLWPEQYVEPCGLTHLVSCLQRADQALADFFTSIVNAVAGIAQVLTGQTKPQVSIAPPSFFNNGAANVSTSLAGVAGTVSSLTHSFPLSLTPIKSLHAYSGCRFQEVFLLHQGSCKHVTTLAGSVNPPGPTWHALGCRLSVVLVLDPKIARLPHA